MLGLINIRWVASGGLLLIGILSLIFSEAFVTRAYTLANAPAENIWLIYALGVALIGAGFAVAVEPAQADTAPRVGVSAGIVLFTLVYFLLLGVHLREWWIDDAGITFAYSRSLAEGLGLVAQPWLPPEEGYSSSVWMLLLSGMARLGFDIPLAAKALGTGFSALAMILCAWVLVREKAGPLALLICGIGIACGPTVVWAVSGQEHALQSALLLLAVLCVYGMHNWRWPLAVILAILVLTRPETPIIVIGVFMAAVLLTRRAGGPLFNAADLAVALLPFLTFLALLGFRLIYFGDLMPNPYYAKSSGTALAGVLNPLGGGWAYILSGLRDTGLLLILGLAFLIPKRPLPDWIVVAVAILCAHAFFVVWAKGDWMGQYRFLMPVVPIMLLLAALGLRSVSGYGARTAFAILGALVVVHTTAMQLTAFKAAPTTPLATITAVGNTFRSLSDRLEIDDPLLAHHDAGGIAYHRMIRLVDLGGLINRTIGQNMDDRAFLSQYLLEETRPDFVFGARNFAASSGFAETEDFEKAYVRLEFADLPYMESDLSYMRRDLVKEAPGLELFHDGEGQLERLRVTVPDQRAK